MKHDVIRVFKLSTVAVAVSMGLAGCLGGGGGGASAGAGAALAGAAVLNPPLANFVVTACSSGTGATCASKTVSGSTDGSYSFDTTTLPGSQPFIVNVAYTDPATGVAKSMYAIANSGTAQVNEASTAIAQLAAAAAGTNITSLAPASGATTALNATLLGNLATAGSTTALTNAATGLISILAAAGVDTTGMTPSALLATAPSASATGVAAVIDKALSTLDVVVTGGTLSMTDATGATVVNITNTSAMSGIIAGTSSGSVSSVANGQTPITTAIKDTAVGLEGSTGLIGLLETAFKTSGTVFAGADTLCSGTGVSGTSSSDLFNPCSATANAAKVNTGLTVNLYGGGTASAVTAYSLQSLGASGVVSNSGGYVTEKNWLVLWTKSAGGSTGRFSIKVKTANPSATTPTWTITGFSKL